MARAIAGGHTMTTTMPTLCPDPDGHARLYVLREQTWRDRAVWGVVVFDLCPWCDGKILVSDGLTPAVREEGR
jgi:hypothetical protein